MKTLCPYCQQDVVWRVALKSDSSIKFRMCFECDSIWTDKEIISDASGSRFDIYMSALNRRPDWMDIVRLTKCESVAPLHPEAGDEVG